jgi:glycine cleavage system H protein
MEGFSLIDIYSTKGIEYLIAAVFFFGFLALQRYIMTSAPGQEKTPEFRAGLPAWFRVPEGYGFHQGHTWMKVDLMSPDRQRLVKVGLDDFAQKLIGRVDAVELPAIGTRLTQGDKGWSLKVDSVAIPMLSPVDGEVVAVNQEVLRSPEILSRDPYGAGWLLKVKSDRIAADTRNLLSGKVARAWMETSLANLHPIPHDTLGPVLQDGGLPLDGIARVLGGDQWVDLAKAHLLTDGE